jgi:hypothetical protein
VDDGIYVAVFDSEDTSVGRGIVVARKGRLHGGDSVCKYRGEHNAEDDTIKVEIVRYNKEQKTIFGDLNYYTFTLKRDEDEGRLSFSGSIEEQPERTITIELTWLGFLIG